MAVKQKNSIVWMLIGVSGSGKTRIGSEVAATLGWVFLDADDLHSASNVERMAHGLALDDAARWPWLDRVGLWIDRHAATHQPSVIACSALKRSYRDALRAGRPRLRLIHLQVGREELACRLKNRGNHFMGPEMLDSQLIAFEPPSDEPVMSVDANGSVDRVVAAILRKITDAG